MARFFNVLVLSSYKYNCVFLSALIRLIRVPVFLFNYLIGLHILDQFYHAVLIVVLNLMLLQVLVIFILLVFK